MCLPLSAGEVLLAWTTLILRMNENTQQKFNPICSPPSAFLVEENLLQIDTQFPWRNTDRMQVMSTTTLVSTGSDTHKDAQKSRCWTQRRLYIDCWIFSRLNGFTSWNSWRRTFCNLSGPDSRTSFCTYDRSETDSVETLTLLGYSTSQSLTFNDLST